MYQRSELYKITQIGGALVRPLFTEYPYIPQYTPDLVDTVMYGDALKVDFIFEAGKTGKTVIQPGSWLDLMTK